MYLTRAPNEDVEKLIMLDFFLLLANQLYQHPPTDDVADACAHLLYGKDACIADKSVSP